MRWACLLDISALALEVALHKLRDLIIVIILFLAILTLFLLHGLVALGELAQTGERIWAELVEDAGHELGELLLFAVAVDGERVCWDGCVDCVRACMLARLFLTYASSRMYKCLSDRRISACARYI